MPVETVPGTGFTYHLIAFDDKGQERQDDPAGRMSKLVVDKLRQEPITDVFIFSHGWMGDVNAARAQYNKWIQAMADCGADIARMQQEVSGFNPLLIGLHWPSLPWGDENLGDPDTSFEIGSAPAGDDATIAAEVEQHAATISNTPEARAALQTVITAAHKGVGPEAPEVSAAYETLRQEAAPQEGGPEEAPGEDHPAFDPQAIIHDVKVTEAEAAAADGDLEFGFNPFNKNTLLAPVRMLSFWKMKDRGRSFGESGGRRLLAALQAAKPGVRFHLMGHSFGCVVVSSILAGPRTGGDAIQPVDSLVLVQGALSLWSYCSSIETAGGRPGYFRTIVDRGVVKGPIVTTRSKHDRAVGNFYPLGAGLAGQQDFALPSLPKFGGVGAWGLRGPGLQIEDATIESVSQEYGFQPGKVYNLLGDAFIKDGDAFSGGHSDIAHPEVGHAVWEAARATL